MLGAASEAAIYELSDAVVIALVPGKRGNQLEDFDKKRNLHRMLVLIAQILQHGSVQAEFKSTQLHLASLFDSIRIQRNEAVHPETGTVSVESLRAAFDAFSHAYPSGRSVDWLAEKPRKFAELILHKNTGDASRVRVSQSARSCFRRGRLHISRGI